tara:strand:- start:6478 stop:7554 length:1077 start_codon:yes stop_codon:yes gene_type:complete
MKFIDRLNLWKKDSLEYKNKFMFDPYFIAEIGVNHENSIEKAKLMIEQASSSGANAVKFQSYKADRLAAKDSPSYWDTTEESTNSQYELFKKYDSLVKEDYLALKNYCDDLGVEFLTTPFDTFFVDELDEILTFYKIASADITNYPLLEKVASKGKPIILSTGASDKKEIESTLKFLETFNVEIILNQCILSYPTEIKEANLGMISDLINSYPNNIVGFSDHTPPTEDFYVQIYSVLLGATFIEKHFTFDKSLPGNDHYHSFDASDLSNFYFKLNQFKEIYGRSVKETIEIELPARKNARRSLYFSSNLKKGSIITNSHLIPKRPGNGLSPINYKKLVGKTINQDVFEDQLVEIEMFE